MNRVKQLREQNNLTQTELGNILGVEKSTISKYEKGSLDLSSNTIHRLCDFFNVSADYLLGRDSVNKNTETDKETQLLIESLKKNPDTHTLITRTINLDKKLLQKILEIIEVVQNQDN